MASTISVYARIRPPERGAPLAEGLSVLDSQQLLVRNLEFSLDHVFDEKATQSAVYDVVARESIAKVASGFNVCVLAYGQTGSGKTHTMFGPDEVLADWRGSGSQEKHGIALRAITDLFEAAGGAGDAAVTASYIEVYNDQCNDLLSGRRALPLREGPTKQPYVEGLAEENVTSMDAAMEALARGSRARTVAQMRMNLRSSRSHAVFSLTVRRGGGGAQGGGASSGSDGNGGVGASVTGKLVGSAALAPLLARLSISIDGAVGIQCAALLHNLADSPANRMRLLHAGALEVVTRLMVEPSASGSLKEHLLTAAHSLLGASDEALALPDILGRFLAAKLPGTQKSALASVQIIREQRPGVEERLAGCQPLVDGLGTAKGSSDAAVASGAAEILAALDKYRK